MIEVRPILDDALFARVVKLLKPEQVQELLAILRSRIVALSRMDDDAMADPAARLHVHRLASEAGMLGFRQLSVLCSILEEGVEHRSVEEVAAARDALPATLECSYEEIRRLSGETQV